MNAETRTGFTIVRELQATVDEVFRAWTEPEHLGWFSGPLPPEHPTKVDLRVGGTWEFHMVQDETTSYMTGGVYREIEPPRRLVFAWGAVDGFPELDPNQLDEVPQVAIDLQPDPAGTRMTLSVDFPGHFTDEMVDKWLHLGVRAGWLETVNRLEPWLSEEKRKSTTGATGESEDRDESLED